MATRPHWLLVLGLLTVGLTPDPILATEGPPKSLNVVILSVADYDNSPWRNPRLAETVKNTTKQLKAFFQSRFPHARIYERHRRDDTTGQELLSFIRNDLAGIAAHNVTLLFVIGHGEPYVTENPLYKSDVMIVGSDATAEAPSRNSFRVGSDLVQQLQELSRDSIVLAFIDACHSGAAASVQVKLQAALQGVLGLRMMLIASALPEARAYSARFTQALLEVWQRRGKGCTANFQIPGKLREIMATMTHLEPGEGLPELVIPYLGNLCLESFQEHNGLLVLGNLSAETMAVRFKNVRTGETWDDSLSGEGATPFRVDRTRIEVEVFWKRGRQLSKEFDFSSKEVMFEVVGAPRSVAAIASGLQRTAELAESIGVRSDVAIEFRKRAYAAFVAANDMISAERIAPEIEASEGIGLWGHLRKLRTFTPSDLIDVQRLFNASTKQVGRALELVGHFAGAANIFKAAAADAAAAGSHPQASELAEEAYFAYGAANDPNMARRIREQYKLNVKDDCQKCTAAERDALAGMRIDAKSDFKALTTAVALTKGGI